MKVLDIYPSLENHSSLVGLPCVIVELGEENASEGIDVAGVVSRLSSFGIERVVIAGEAPLEEEEIYDLIDRLLEADYEVILHTTGTRDLALIDDRVRRVLMIDAPSLFAAGRKRRLLWGNLERLKPGDEVHFTVADREDYAWAREVVENHELLERVPIHISPIPGRLPEPLLARWIVEDGLDIRLLPALSILEEEEAAVEAVDRGESF